MVAMKNIFPLQKFSPLVDFEVLMVVAKMAVFCVVMPCSLVDVYSRF